MAPEAYYLDMAGFRFPIMIEEYIEGESIKSLNDDLLTKIGAAIARINNVTIGKSHPFDTRAINYLRDIDTLRSTYTRIVPTRHHIRWLALTHEFLQSVRKKLSCVTPEVPSMLIRRDANPCNFIITDTGVVMVDWEITRIDDPTVTLASFINELTVYDVLHLCPSEKSIEVVKNAFAHECEIRDFEILLHNRLMLEKLGGLIWALERIAALNSGQTHHIDFESRLAWYQEVAERSSQALECALSS